MVKFIPAELLKKKYDVYGHFYALQYNENHLEKCRSVLEIISKDVPIIERSQLSKNKPDAVFIMMNPGSSRPLEKDYEYNQQVIKVNDLSNLNIELVAAKPDITQYQIMRLMDLFNWHHVRVINLSDLRCANSNDFMKMVSVLGAEKMMHSVFSEVRKNELVRKLKRKDGVPLIGAWGLNNKLLPMISLAVDSLKYEKIIGLEKDENMYCHPLPSLQVQKEKWIKDMVKVLMKVSLWQK